MVHNSTAQYSDPTQAAESDDIDDLFKVGAKNQKQRKTVKSRKAKAENDQKTNSLGQKPKKDKTISVVMEALAGTKRKKKLAPDVAQPPKKKPKFSMF